MYNRKRTKSVRVGGVGIGADFPISIQSMTNTDTRDIEATIKQVRELTEAGCEIIRISVPTNEAAEAFKEIRRRANNVPLVADIHFDYRLAIASIKAGADKIRINPGNIGSNDKVKMVVDAAKERRIPIRIGINSGSLEADIIDKYSGVTAEGLAESAIRNVRLLENMDFGDIVVSVKSSNVPLTLKAHKIISNEIDYPLHIGITEAGTLYTGTIKSTAAIASLLTNGIGDTVRISLTANPVEEIKAAKELLQALQIRMFRPEIISCPTCGRTDIDLISIAEEVERRTINLKNPIKIAIMGCVVNGPGEAKEADVGIAGGKGVGILFRKGEIIRKVSENELVSALMDEIDELTRESEWISRNFMKFFS